MSATTSLTVMKQGSELTLCPAYSTPAFPRQSGQHRLERFYCKAIAFGVLKLKPGGLVGEGINLPFFFLILRNCLLLFFM